MKHAVKGCMHSQSVGLQQAIVAYYTHLLFKQENPLL